MTQGTTATMVAVNGPWKLPDGWQWMPLGEVCQINPRRPRMVRDHDAPTSFLPMPGVDEVDGVITKCEGRPYREVAQGFTYFEEGDVLFAKITPSMQNGKCAIARGLIDGIGFGSTEFHVIRPGADITADWVHRYMRRLVFRLEAKEHFRGAVGQQRVPEEFIKSSLIPVPPSVEIQRRIMARIEAIVAEVKRARELLKQMRNDIERLMASVLVETFEDLPTRSSDWQEEPVSQFCHKPQYGYTESADWEPVGPKFLRITDIQDNKVNWDTVPYCHIPNGQLSRYLLESSDILFARSGATTGKTFLVQECPLTVFASYLIRLRVREKVCPDFLAWFFRSRKYWSQIQPRGAAQPNMNAKLLEEIRVPYPKSQEIQRQIISYLGSIQTELDGMQNLLDQDARLVDQIEQSILERAFRGEL